MTAASSRTPWLAAVLLVAAVALAYANSLQVPFLFDDIIAVTENPTIRDLRTALTPPEHGGTTTGRPLLNLTLAINYALGGEAVEGYHALNLLIHAGATLLLFGLVRRTLATPTLTGRLRASPDAVAFAVALGWAVHPLLTESVTCIAQRSESQCGLLLLATLYCLARAGQETRWTPLWLGLSVLASLAGMATKEVMVTAPVLALLYDRTFLAGSFREAWRRRGRYHLALAATWLMLALTVIGFGGSRGAAAGFGLGVTVWSYLLTQCEALVLYLRLSFWPHPLIIDYGKDVVTDWTAVWWQGLVVLGLLGATGWSLVRRPALGFLGAWFFLILAPSSSVVPLVGQTIAEHRMYLPLAAVVTLVAVAAARWLTPRVFLGAALAVGVAAAVGTHRRNTDFLDEQALWEDVLVHRPTNGRALNNLGRVHLQRDRFDQAADYFRRSLAVEPGNATAEFNLGLALMKAGHLAESEAPLRRAVQILPGYYNAHLTLGMVLIKLGRAQEALAHFAVARHYDPWPASLHFQGGLALAQLGHWEEAIAHYRRSLQLNPRNAKAHSNWGAALLAVNRPGEAIPHFETALRLTPDQAEVFYNLGQAYSALGQSAEAMHRYAEAIRLDPAQADARLNLGIALAQANQLPEAIEQLTAAAKLRPDDAKIQTNLGTALGLAARPTEALAAYEKALALKPDDAQAHYNVGYALLEANRWPEAAARFEAALRLQPGFRAAREMLQRLRESGIR
jgi:tetratricopeptide (TPR) repeat protein